MIRKRGENSRTAAGSLVFRHPRPVEMAVFDALPRPVREALAAAAVKIAATSVSATMQEHAEDGIEPAESIAMVLDAVQTFEARDIANFGGSDVSIQRP